MPKFDIWSTPSKKLTAIKVKKENTSKVKGSIYLTTLTSSTAKAVLIQANTRVQSGLIKFPKTSAFSPEDIKIDPPKELVKVDAIKKCIYCDVNGVLDDIEKEFNYHESPVFSVPKVACPHKIMKLVKLALKHQAYLIMISLWRKHIDFNCLIGRCLLNCGIQEYIDFYMTNEDAIDELCMVASTEDFGKRTDEVRHHINQHHYSHFVVFEDSHPIDTDLNPIRTQSIIGLLDEHIDKADKILSKPF